MMSYRKKRFCSTLKHCLGNILLNELDNPEFRLLSISEIVVSNDLRTARVYISSPQNNIDDILIKLNRAKGFIKKQLPKKMMLKYVPNIVFLRDVGFELDQTLSEINKI